MVLPTTYASAFALLLLSLVCFTLWPNLYKRVEARWRYELFALDFALTAFVFALVAAYTLGTFGSEMSFTDRMLVAGRSAEVWIIGAGVIFAFSNLMLLATISLLGLAAGELLTFGTALALVALLHLKSGQGAVFSAGIALLLLCIVSAVLASRPSGANEAKPRYRNPRAARTKGAILAVLGGLTLGATESVLRLIADPEFGPGPYAILLMLSIGLLVSTPLFNFFFMNIKVTGDPISFRSYKAGIWRQHAPGVVSGLLWSIGVLAVLLAMSVTGDQAPGSASILVFPFGSVLICSLLGWLYWKELTGKPGMASMWLGAGLVAFGAGLVALGAGFQSR